MPPGQQSKGNPATRRMSSTTAASRREKSWKRGQQKKQAHREDQAARETANKTNGVTKWELAKQARAEKRRPLRAQWAKRNKDNVLSAS